MQNLLHARRVRPAGIEIFPLRCASARLVIAGTGDKRAEDSTPKNDLDIAARTEELLAKGLSRREAAKQVSRETGLPSRRIYKETLPSEPSKEKRQKP